MAQPKALASLSSTLLARKGTARPAMRPQGFGGGFATMASTADDLGWNDMGAPEPDQAVHTPVPAPVPVPAVLVEREELKAEIERVASEAAPVAVKLVSVATATRIGRESAALTKKSKAAFTLRLETERHLRLRLASAVTNLSSQKLVTQALDAFLSSLPEVDALIAQLPSAKTAK
ncbi:hypothetical protein FSB78_06225 [Sphingomonas ginsenosidivorax]|uniref:Uncharacterized protein n=1 Tax=Sphingomonas ginsenosidivorax TaxID=862135 RepID=A0A5C6UCZ9_9SPHN|nr:hypothetical protein [Sphingomonas ginsenosidivorax]TXC70579.1 hypothetical protein FSB78_06225 [Sphingomonas ginsenosidivorax]